MFVIEATNTHQSWVSGIFQHKAEAITYLDSIPKPLCSIQKMLEIPQTCFPIFILEQYTFEYGCAEFIQSRINCLVPKGDDDFIHMNIFIVDKDFVPIQAGLDFMGILPHWHIADAELGQSNMELLQ